MCEPVRRGGARDTSGASRSAWRRNACVRGRLGRLGLVRFGRARAGVYEHYAGRGLFRARRSWIGIEREPRAPHPGLPPNAWCSWRRGRDSTGSGTPDRSRRSSRGDHVLTQAPVWRLRSEWVVLPIRGDDTHRPATARLAPLRAVVALSSDCRGAIVWVATDLFITTATLRVMRDARRFIVLSASGAKRRFAALSCLADRCLRSISPLFGHRVHYRRSMGIARSSAGRRWLATGACVARSHVEANSSHASQVHHPRRGGAVAPFCRDGTRVACREDDVGVAQPPRRRAQPPLRLGRLVRRRRAFEARASGRPTAAR